MYFIFQALNWINEDMSVVKSLKKSKILEPVSLGVELCKILFAPGKNNGKKSISLSSVIFLVLYTLGKSRNTKWDQNFLLISCPSVSLHSGNELWKTYLCKGNVNFFWTSQDIHSYSQKKSTFWFFFNINYWSHEWIVQWPLPVPAQSKLIFFSLLITL